MKSNFIVVLGLLCLPSCETPQFRNSKNFAFLGVALGAYEDATGHLPHDIGNKLSWRVELLRSGEPDLYKKFHLDEPWDSAHNRQLIKEIPNFFQDPFREAELGQTRYLGVTGEGCAFEKGKIVAKPRVGESMRVAIVMTRNTVPWTKPCDVAVEDVESGDCIRWFDGFSNFLGWSGAPSAWPKSTPPDEPASKPIFRLDKSKPDH